MLEKGHELEAGDRKNVEADGVLLQIAALHISG